MNTLSILYFGNFSVLAYTDAIFEKKYVICVCLELSDTSSICLSDSIDLSSMIILFPIIVPIDEIYFLRGCYKIFDYLLLKSPL